MPFASGSALDLDLILDRDDARGRPGRGFHELPFLPRGYRPAQQDRVIVAGPDLNLGGVEARATMQRSLDFRPHLRDLRRWAQRDAVGYAQYSHLRPDCLLGGRALELRVDGAFEPDPPIRYMDPDRIARYHRIPLQSVDGGLRDLGIG